MCIYINLYIYKYAYFSRYLRTSAWSWKNKCHIRLEVYRNENKSRKYKKQLFLDIDSELFRTMITEKRETSECYNYTLLVPACWHFLDKGTRRGNSSTVWQSHWVKRNRILTSWWLRTEYPWKGTYAEKEFQKTIWDPCSLYLNNKPNMFTM